MQRAIELDILHAKLNYVRAWQRDHEGRITALEVKTSPPQPSRSPPSSINWRRLLKPIKASFGAISFLVRHWGMLSIAAVAVWAVILPILQYIWKQITGFFAYVVSVGIGV